METIDNRPCARLDQYLFMAKGYLKFCKDNDAHARPILSNRNAKGLAEDEKYLVDEIARQIKEQGLNLEGMLASIKMESRIDDICRIYARLVLAHKDDENCEGITFELIGAGFKIVRSGTCSQV